MDTSSPDLQSLTARIEKLERQNGHFKRGGLALLLAAATLTIMGQARPSTRTVDAQNFVLTDAEGKKRAELGFEAGNPKLRFFHKDGTEAGSYSDSNLTFGNAKGATILNSTSLTFFADNESEIVQLGNALNPEAAIRLWDIDGKQHLNLNVTSGGPSLSLNDAEGFAATIGATDLLTPRTGQHHTTSAASLVLFGKGGKVLWSAP